MKGVVGLLSAAEQVSRQLSSTIEPFGITGQQYNVLRILLGAEPESLPTLEIAERMLEPTPGITRLLDRLEKKGLVTRKRHSEDRRQVLCSITPPGIELLKGMEEPVNAANIAALAMLSEQDLVELIRLLKAIQEGR